jgi:O-acetylhomoserine (thiol)-lyase
MEAGYCSVIFSTGMAAISATIFGLIRKSDHIIVSSFLFGNTSSIFQTFIDLGIDITFVDMMEMQNLQAAVKSNTKLVFVETIANPVTQIVDLENIGTFCERYGLLYVVDNTMTSPYLFNPISVKASLVINSLTKYVGGHGNALGGSVTDTGLFDWSKFPNIYEIFKHAGNPKGWGSLQIRKRGLRDSGGAISPDAAHLISMGSETLALRMEKSCSNAMILARFFEKHSQIAKVFFPGLSSHPQHKLAKRLFKRFGSLMSIELNHKINVFDFLNKLKLVVKSSNLGDTRTLAIPVAHTLFYEIGSERRKEMGISDNLIRLSIGIEDIEDLQEDFLNAL